MTEQSMKSNSEVRVVRREAFYVAGISATYPFGGVPVIGAQWMQFTARRGELPARTGNRTYGICDGMFGSGEHYTYLAGCEVPETAALPSGFVRLQVPAHSYAVFEHGGHIAGIAQTVQRGFRRLLPDAGLERIGNPDLIEIYDERFDSGTASGVVELWIPIRQP